MTLRVHVMGSTVDDVTCSGSGQPSARGGNRTTPRGGRLCYAAHPWRQHQRPHYHGGGEGN